MDLATIVGALAALGTTVSYFPQLKKCWDTGSSSDLSLWMFLILAGGVFLWIVYGALKADWVIVAANSVSFCCLLGLLYFRLTDPKA